MKSSKLKLHKTNIVKLTQLTKIFGGSENSETTYTTTGNSDTNTQATTTTIASNGKTYCASSNSAGECPTNTNDTINNNNTVPTFNQTIQPGP